MSDARQRLKQKVSHEMREYLVIFFYLFVVFSLLVVHRSMILAEHHIDYTLHGFALINALALAKVMLVAQDLHLADRFHDAPLIYPTLAKVVRVYGCVGLLQDCRGLCHRQNSRQVVPGKYLGSWRRDLERNFDASGVAVRYAHSVLRLH